MPSRWLVPRRGASGDGSGQAVWTRRTQARLVAWPRLARPHGAVPEPPSRRALSGHQPSPHLRRRPAGSSHRLLGVCFELDSEPPIPAISGAAVSHDDLVLAAADRNRFAAFL